jgi:hypothetical protein
VVVESRGDQSVGVEAPVTTSPVILPPVTAIAPVAVDSIPHAPTPNALTSNAPTPNVVGEIPTADPKPDWQTIETPGVDVLLGAQRYDPDVMEWMKVFMGRALFSTRDRTWDIYPTLLHSIATRTQDRALPSFGVDIKTPF